MAASEPNLHAAGWPAIPAPVAGIRLLKPLAMIAGNGTIAHVLYPVFPSGQNVIEVLAWRRQTPK